MFKESALQSARPKVALVNSILYRRDAVSNIAYAKLSAYSGAHAQYDVRAFVYDTDYTDANIQRVKSIAELLNDPYFRAADVVVWQFGMFYELFDALLVND